MDTGSVLKHMSFAGAKKVVPPMEVSHIWRDHLWRVHCTMFDSSISWVARQRKTHNISEL